MYNIYTYEKKKKELLKFKKEQKLEKKQNLSHYIEREKLADKYFDKISKFIYEMADKPVVVNNSYYMKPKDTKSSSGICLKKFLTDKERVENYLKNTNFLNITNKFNKNQKIKKEITNLSFLNRLKKQNENIFDNINQPFMHFRARNDLERILDAMNIDINQKKLSFYNKQIFDEANNKSKKKHKKEGENKQDNFIYPIINSKENNNVNSSSQSPKNFLSQLNNNSTNNINTSEDTNNINISYNNANRNKAFLKKKFFSSLIKKCTENLHNKTFFQGAERLVNSNLKKTDEKSIYIENYPKIKIPSLGLHKKIGEFYKAKDISPKNNKLISEFLLEDEEQYNNQTSQDTFRGIDQLNNFFGTRKGIVISNISPINEKGKKEKYKTKERSFMKSSQRFIADYCFEEGEEISSDSSLNDNGQVELIKQIIEKEHPILNNNNEEDNEKTLKIKKQENDLNFLKKLSSSQNFLLVNGKLSPTSSISSPIFKRLNKNQENSLNEKLNNSASLIFNKTQLNKLNIHKKDSIDKISHEDEHYIKIDDSIYKRNDIGNIGKYVLKKCHFINTKFNKNKDNKLIEGQGKLMMTNGLSLNNFIEKYSLPKFKF